MANEVPQPGFTYRPGDDSGQPPGDNSPAAPDTARPAFQPVPETAEVRPAMTDEGTASVSWTASEFVAHHKNIAWYLAITLGIGGIAGIIYFLTNDYISSGVIGLAGFLFMILGSHKPRELAYKVDESGITIGQKFYPFSEFKSFGVHEEGVIGSINLLPLKRFMPELSIYYPPEQEDKIVDILKEHLPHEQRDEHHVDRLLKKIRF